MDEDNEELSGDELMNTYLIGLTSLTTIVPLSGWSTGDLIALAEHIDNELMQRDEAREEQPC